MVTDTTLDSAACWQHMPQLPHQPCYQLPSADDVCLELSRQEGKLQALVCRSTCSSAGPSLKSVKLLQTASSRLHMLLKMAASFACTVSRSRTVAAGPQAFTHRMPAPPQARSWPGRSPFRTRTFLVKFSSVSMYMTRLSSGCLQALQHPSTIHRQKFCSSGSSKRCCRGRDTELFLLP